MKNLSNIYESIVDAENTTPKKILTSLKKEVTAWAKTNCKKNGGRIKIDWDETSSNFRLSWSGETFEVDFANIPQRVTLDIDCNYLDIKNPIDNYLSYFSHIEVSNALFMSYSSKYGVHSINFDHLIIGCPLDGKKSSIHKVIVANHDDETYDLSTLSGTTIDEVQLHTGYEYKKTYKYNLDGLKLDRLELYVGPYCGSDYQTYLVSAELEGNWDAKSADIRAFYVKGLPKSNKIEDSWGLSTLAPRKVTLDDILTLIKDNRWSRNMARCFRTQIFYPELFKLLLGKYDKNDENTLKEVFDSEYAGKLN